METIFDFNPTEKEVKRFVPKILFNKEKYLQCVSLDTALFHIGWLFLIRGEKEKAYSYFDRVNDKSLFQVFMQDF